MLDIKEIAKRAKIDEKYVECYGNDKAKINLSIMDELNKLNPHFYYDNQEIEPFNFFAKHSHISVVRIRLWNNPYDKYGHPYGGGTNDLSCFIRLAKKAINNGTEKSHIRLYLQSGKKKRFSKWIMHYELSSEDYKTIQEYRVCLFCRRRLSRTCQGPLPSASPYLRLQR